jgi:hypothetical protein
MKRIDIKLKAKLHILKQKNRCFVCGNEMPFGSIALSFKSTHVHEQCFEEEMDKRDTGLPYKLQALIKPRPLTQIQRERIANKMNKRTKEDASISKIKEKMDDDRLF